MSWSAAFALLARVPFHRREGARYADVLRSCSDLGRNLLMWQNLQLKIAILSLDELFVFQS